MSVGMPGYNTTTTEMSAATGAKPATSTDSSLQVTSASSEAVSTVMSEDDKPLPEKVAY
ncbi:MAG: peptidase M15A, partial [Mesorhizobium sp.]